MYGYLRVQADTPIHIHASEHSRFDATALEPFVWQLKLLYLNYILETSRAYDSRESGTISFNLLAVTVHIHKYMCIYANIQSVTSNGCS